MRGETEPQSGSPGPPGAVRLTHQPALDGLRGLAVAAVVLYHAAAANNLPLEQVTRGGFLGVSAFFTLSGFLICALLRRETESSGSVSLRNFWERRGRRLLPASLATIAVVALLTPLIGTQSQLQNLPGDVWSSLAYVANWRFILDGSDYAAQFSGAPSPLRHIWSLSVEEQWYLLVPLAGLAWVGLKRTGRQVSLAKALALTCLLGTAWMVIRSGGAYTNRAYMGTDTRLAEMGIGALAAAVLRPGLRVPGKARALVMLLAPLLAIALIVVWSTVSLENPWLYRGGLSLHAVAIALVIVAAVQPAGPLRRWMATAPLVSLGLISYAVYLFHWPLIWWLTPDRLHVSPWIAMGIQLTVTVVLAKVSYHYLEQPIRHGKALVGPRLALIGVSAVAVIAAVALVLPSADRTQVVAIGAQRGMVGATAPEQLDPIAEADPTTPAEAAAPRPSEPTTTAVAKSTTTAPLPPLKVMVVGDSFADSIVIGLQRRALAAGDMGIINETIVACPFGRGGRHKGINRERELASDCLNREGSFATAVQTWEPDLIVVAGGLWDITDRRPPGFGWTHIGRPDYDDYLRSELAHFANVVGQAGVPVIWANSPHWDPVPGSVIFMGEPPYSESEAERVDRFNAMLNEVVAPRPEVTLLDLAGWMNAQPGGEFDPALRPDGVHFSEESTDKVAAWLAPELNKFAGR